MKIQIKNELILIDILSLFLIAIITLTPFRVVRIILGLALILFFPGYTLLTALFPKRTDLDTIERVALSFGLSIAVVPLVSLVLNYTPWGIRLYPILISLTAFIIVMSVLAWFRKRHILPSERLNITMNLNFAFWAEQSKLHKILATALIASVIIAIGTLVYVISTPRAGEEFTEFYLLGGEEETEGYPRKLVIGESGHVILGIVNHEHEPTTYTARVLIENQQVNSIGPVTLQNKEKWEKKIDFSPSQPGENIKVKFLLYKDNQSDPYHTLQLWIDVLEKGKIR